MDYEYKDKNLTISSGDRIAITGKNGCGKTSLLKLILGEDISHEGNVTIGNNLHILCMLSKHR